MMPERSLDILRVAALLLPAALGIYALGLMHGRQGRWFRLRFGRRAKRKS